MTSMHRADRLIQLRENEVDFGKELQNIGHEDWSPYDHPEWLLMECENGIMVRQVQQRIARQMMSPPNGQNATIQLNMGEGKSSVIVPIVTAALGDGSQLVRAIVAKPQFKQMLQILVSKHGGMVGRRVYQLPISRAIRLNQGRVEIIRRMIEKCLKEGGIMLTQPEHILSFQLMAIERQISGHDELAGKLLEVQDFFDAHSRDVIDESDENFSVKFELVYTIG